MSAPVIRRVVVRGRVQGVGFRAFVEDEARQRRIAGWVRNRRDGSVEAAFAGSLDEVERITAAVRHGPPGARVEAVECQAGDEDLRQRLAGDVFGAPDDLNACSRRTQATLAVAASRAVVLAPNSASNSRRRTLSTSGIVTGRPRSIRLVTPKLGSDTPHGTMPKSARGQDRR